MSFKSNQKRECEGESFMYNAVVNRSHKRRNDYSNKSNIDEKFYDVGEREGGRQRSVWGVSKSFQQFSLSGTNAFGVGFSLWLRIWLEKLWFMAFRHQNWQHVATTSPRAEQRSAEPSPSRARYQDIWLKNEPATMKNLCWPRHMMNA